MSEQRKLGWWIPETPGGTVLMRLKAKTEDVAWAKLLKEASHMPYRGKEGFRQRGYKVQFWEQQND